MKGHCLCGAVTVEAPEHHQVAACHCGMCRRWSGGPMLAVHCGAQVVLSGSGAVRAYRSSDWAERGFCGTCGTHLYYKLLPTGEYILPAGLFEDDARFAFTGQIFIDRKPGYYAFANETANLTEQEVFAMFSPDGSSAREP